MTKKQNIKKDTLKKLWDKLTDTPINNNEEIETDFYIFKSGTNREEIWLWFEEQGADIPKSLGSQLKFI